MKCGSSLRGTNGEFLRNPRRSQYGQQYRTVRMLFIDVIRSPLLMSGSVFHRTHAGLGLALKRSVFAQCVITPYSSGNRTTEEPTNIIGGFLFFIRHYESSIPTGASGASQTTQCQSVAMLDQGQKTVMRKGTGNHWLRTLGNLYIIIFQRAHSNEQG